MTAGAPRSFTTSTAYNIDGTLQSTSMPAVAGLPAEAVANKYNGLGMLTGTDGMTDYVQNIGYSPYGEIEETRLGTSTGAKQLQILNRFEDGTRRLTNTHTVDQTNAGRTSDIDYLYDVTGNVTSITDKTAGQDTQCFAYDGHRRLTDAWTPSSNSCATARAAAALGGPAPYWTSWSYKPGGLRATQTEHKSTGDTQTVYGYPTVSSSGTGQPHTLTSATVGSDAAKTFTYDEQGNTTRRPGPTGTVQTLAWDIEGELTRLTEGTKTTDYLYDANGELLIRRGPTQTVLYLDGQELHYDTPTKKFSAQRYYPAGGATAVRTETGLSWMVDDHHGTASMSVDATTQAVTRRYTKPFGESRGTAPTSWPDDKGFLGKPADADTGLTHIGAREYDPATGRFLSVDPVLAPDDHESLNGYAYANNTPVTKSDPTGLRPITDCERGCSDGKGGTYQDYMTPGRNGGWVYHSTQTYTQTFQYQKKGGGTGSGTMTVTVRTDAGHTSARVSFKKGPDPKPERRDGSQCRSCWAMGTNPYYSASADDLPDNPKLATWQKVVLGLVVGVAAAVVAAPAAVAVGDGCLAAAPVCAAEIAEMLTGSSAVVGGSLKFVNAAEHGAPKNWYNCGACAIATDSTLAGTPMRAWDSGILAPEALEKYFGSTFNYQPKGAAGVAEELLEKGEGARGVIFAWQDGDDIRQFFNAVNHGGPLGAHAQGRRRMIDLESATQTAQEFGTRNLPMIDGLQWGFKFRGISKSGLYLFQITADPPTENERPRFGGSPGIVVDSNSGDCRHVRGHQEYKNLLREIAEQEPQDTTK